MPLRTRKGRLFAFKLGELKTQRHTAGELEATATVFDPGLVSARPEAERPTQNRMPARDLAAQSRHP
jgi:hypothetical protein